MIWDPLVLLSNGKNSRGELLRAFKIANRQSTSFLKA